jgi:hypothetical protein
MPQVWMTYQELGDLAGIESQEARDFAIAQGWRRRRSRDGLTRVKLPQDLVKAYLLSLIEPSQFDLASKMAAILRSTLPMNRDEARPQPKTGALLMLQKTNETRSAI